MKHLSIHFQKVIIEKVAAAICTEKKPLKKTWWSRVVINISELVIISNTNAEEGKVYCI